MLLSSIVSLQLIISVADRIPHFDLEPACRDWAAGSIGLKQELGLCLSDEQEARQQLERAWGEFSGADRESCIRLEKPGGDPTYTELLTCLEMARESKKLPHDDAVASGSSHRRQPNQPSNRGIALDSPDN
jgi:hypothetical protein